MTQCARERPHCFSLLGIGLPPCPMMGWILGKEKKKLQKRGQRLKQAAQRGDGVTIPGSTQETFRCCTKGHGLVGEY